MSICARNHCSSQLTSDNSFEIPSCSASVKCLYDTEFSTCLCAYHFEECQKIMPSDCHIDDIQSAAIPSSSLFKWEYDPATGTIDYFSTKKTSRKASERVLCLKPADNANEFRLVNVLYNEEAVSDDRIVDLVAKLNNSIAASEDAMKSPAAKSGHTKTFVDSPDSIIAAVEGVKIVLVEEKPVVAASTMESSTPVSKPVIAEQASCAAGNTADIYEAKAASNPSSSFSSTTVKEKQMFVLDDLNAIQRLRSAFFTTECLHSMVESDRASFKLTKPNMLVKTNLMNSSSGSLSPVSSPSKMILKSMIKPSASCETLPDFNDVCEFIPILVSIEGNIGAGKSTLLKALKKSQLDWCFIDEPLDTWTSLVNDNGVNLLELFYGDQHRWAYTFQNCAVLSRYQNIEKTIAKVRSSTEDEIRSKLAASGGAASDGKLERVYKVFITERCLDTDYQVFAKMMKADGQFDSLEFNLYYRWYQLLSSSSTSLSAIVYVDTEPETCSERIKCRNREGEDGIPVAYLKSLHQFQTNWIQNSNVPSTRVTSMELDAAVAFINSIVTDVNAQFI